MRSGKLQVFLCNIVWVVLPLFVGDRALAQSFDVEVTIDAITPPGAGFNATSFSIAPPATVGQELAQESFLFDETVCGGLGDLVREDVERFQDLTEARTRATTAAEQSRLDREIFEQALRLPESITQDLGERQLQLGQSEECDTLIEAVTQLMEQVADYVAVLERSKTQISW